jgi:hypothetical protein
MRQWLGRSWCIFENSTDSTSSRLGFLVTLFRRHRLDSAGSPRADRRDPDAKDGEDQA